MFISLALILPQKSPQHKGTKIAPTFRENCAHSEHHQTTPANFSSKACLLVYLSKFHLKGTHHCVQVVYKLVAAESRGRLISAAEHWRSSAEAPASAHREPSSVRARRPLGRTRPPRRWRQHQRRHDNQDDRQKPAAEPASRHDLSTRDQ